jgi:hypothetical protein
MDSQSDNSKRLFGATPVEEAEQTRARLVAGDGKRLGAYSS